MNQLGIMLRVWLKVMTLPQACVPASLLHAIIAFLLYLLIKDDTKIVLKQRHPHNFLKNNQKTLKLSLKGSNKYRKILHAVETLKTFHNSLRNHKTFDGGVNLLNVKAGPDTRWSLMLLCHLAPPLASFPILGPNEWRQLGSPGWCCALLGGIDSWIIPQATAADYQPRSHQGLPDWPPPLQLLFNLSIASPCPLRCPPVTPRQERDAFPEPAARVLLTGNLNSNNYCHYWCHKRGSVRSQGDNKGPLIQHARPDKSMPTGNKNSNRGDEGLWFCPACVCMCVCCIQKHNEAEAADSNLNLNKA